MSCSNLYLASSNFLSLYRLTPCSKYFVFAIKIFGIRIIIKANFNILDALEKISLSKSRSETKRLIKSKGIKVNDEMYLSTDFSLEKFYDQTEIKISVGKKNIGILKIKK